MKLIKFLIVTGMMLVVGGCQQAEVEVTGDSESLYFETIGWGHFGTIRDTTEAIIRTSDEWDSVSANYRPLEDFQEVDFSQVMVALIALPADYGGYSIEVESVESVGGIVTVSYLVSEPGTDCITPTALTLPFQAVLIRKAEGRVEFVRRTESFKCGM